ncbi:MAG TPA: TonB-dependent siderophore receptor [Allosphingosinicella sp.]|nr:TonB-dependent siderophore receptor [Allosphingosinicella sp.]
MKTVLAASAASLLIAAPALAQDRDREGPRQQDIVVTGTKTGDFGAKSGIPIERVPQSIQVIDDEEIIASGARTVEDALRAVPSATVARSRIGGFGGATLRIRGFAAQQIRNGIFQRFYDSTDPSALSNVERIEILKGPSGVLYGQSGVGGIVSIVTKRPTEAFEGWVALTGGMYDQKMATVDIGGPLTDTLGIRLTGEIERSGSFVDFLDVDRENFGLALAWRPGASVSAHLVAEYLHRKTLNNPGLPTVGTVVGNGVARVKRSAFLGEPGYSLQENDAALIQAWADVKLGGAWTLTPRFQYSEWNNVGRSTTLLPPVAPQSTLIPREGRNAGERDRFYVAQLDLSGKATTFGLGHELLFGIEYNNDDVPFRMQPIVPCGVGPIDALDPVYGCGPPTGNFGFLADARLEGFAVYAQDQIALTEAWNVVAGIRHSQATNDNIFTTAFFSSTNSAKLRNTSWQLGSTYKLGKGVSLFGGYNTGYDLGAVTGTRRADGIPFEPETSDQAEAGVRLTRDDLRAGLSAFRVRRNNVGVPDPLNFAFQVQEGQFRVRGIELEGEWSPAPGWWLQGGYAYLDGVVSRTTTPGLLGARLAETPEHSVTAATRVTLGKVELRAAAYYVGARKVINGGAVTLPDFATVDVGAGTQIGPFRIDAALTNLFDQVYYYSDNASRFSLGTEDRVLPGEPRTLSLRLAYNFGRNAR